MKMFGKDFKDLKDNCLNCIHRDTCYILHDALAKAMQDLTVIDKLIGREISEDIFKNCIENIAKNCKHYKYKPYTSGKIDIKSDKIAMVTIISSDSDKITDAMRDLILGEESGFIHIHILKRLITDEKSRYYTLKGINTMICILNEMTNLKHYALIELEAKNRVPVFIVIDEKIDSAHLVVANSTADLAKELADIDFKEYKYPEGNPCVSKAFDYNEVVDKYFKVVDIMKTYGVM